MAARPSKRKLTVYIDGKPKRVPMCPASTVKDLVGEVRKRFKIGHDHEVKLEACVKGGEDQGDELYEDDEIDVIDPEEIVMVRVQQQQQQQHTPQHTPAAPAVTPTGGGSVAAQQTQQAQQQAQQAQDEQQAQHAQRRILPLSGQRHAQLPATAAAASPSEPPGAPPSYTVSASPSPSLPLQLPQQDSPPDWVAAAAPRGATPPQVATLARNKHDAADELGQDKARRKVANLEAIETPATHVDISPDAHPDPPTCTAATTATAATPLEAAHDKNAADTAAKTAETPSAARAVTSLVGAASTNVVPVMPQPPQSLAVATAPGVILKVGRPTDCDESNCRNTAAKTCALHHCGAHCPGPCEKHKLAVARPKPAAATGGPAPSVVGSAVPAATAAPPDFIAVPSAVGLASRQQEPYKLPGAMPASARAPRVGYVIMTLSTKEASASVGSKLQGLQGPNQLATLQELRSKFEVETSGRDSELLQALTSLESDNNVWESPLLLTWLEPKAHAPISLDGGQWR